VRSWISHKTWAVSFCPFFLLFLFRVSRTRFSGSTTTLVGTQGYEKSGHVLTPAPFLPFSFFFVFLRIVSMGRLTRQRIIYQEIRAVGLPFPFPSFFLPFLFFLFSLFPRQRGARRSLRFSLRLPSSSFFFFFFFPLPAPLPVIISAATNHHAEVVKESHGGANRFFSFFSFLLPSDG